MKASDILRQAARGYARKLVMARLAGKGRNALWRPMAIKLLRLARQIDKMEETEAGR